MQVAPNLYNSPIPHYVENRGNGIDCMQLIFLDAVNHA